MMNWKQECKQVVDQCPPSQQSPKKSGSAQFPLESAQFPFFGIGIIPNRHISNRHMSSADLQSAHFQSALLAESAGLILITGFFLYKTEKLSSDFSRTQIPKIFKNSVFARKLSSRTVDLWKFSPKIAQKRQFQTFFARKPSNFQKTQFQKGKNSVFQKFLKHK